MSAWPTTLFGKKGVSGLIEVQESVLGNDQDKLLQRLSRGAASVTDNMTFDYDLNQFTNTYSNSRRHQALGNGQEVPYVGSGIYGGSQELATVKVCAYFSFVKWDTHSEVTINSTMENSFKTIDTRRLAYVFYITENSLSTLECPLRVQLAALQSTNPRPSIDIVITTTGNLTFSTPYGVKVIQFPHAATSGSYQWRDVFDKLMFSNLVQYDRVVYLEIDTIILRNMDHLFDISPFKIESIAAPRAYWLKQPFFQAGGPLVMDPSSKLISQFDTVLKVKSKKTYPGDMDWLNEEFGNTAILMDGFLALLIAEWMPGDGVFNHFGNSFNMSSKDVKHMAMMVHFIAGHKPWVTSRQGVRKMYPSAPGELYDLYDRWFDLQDIVCRRDEMNEQPAAKDEKTRKNKKKLII